jgi:hypothetical protein
VGSLLNNIVTLLITLTSIAPGESGYHAYLQWAFVRHTQAGGPLEIPFRLSTLFLGAEEVYGRLPLKRLHYHMSGHITRPISHVPSSKQCTF